jgi:phosphate transport system substrate-binding protein
VKRIMTQIVLALGVVALASCGGSNPSNDKTKGAGRINGSGSSFVAPMMKKWAGAYNKAKGVEVDYNSTGSGTGVTQMTERQTDFGCTDAPMNDEQLQKAKANGGDVIHVPLVMGGVVPAYNLPDIEKPLNFTGPILADIFLGKIKKWNDPALVKINEGVKLPDLDIVVASRSDASGTSYIFTDYLSKVSPAWNEKVGKSTQPKWPTGLSAPKNDGVAGLVSGTKGAIGYVELIYALDKKSLQYGAVQNTAGQFLRASLESVTAAAANAKDIPEDLRFSLTNAEGKDSYPISGTVWMVTYVKHPKDKAIALTEFLTWVLHDGQDLTQELHYARLPKELVDRAEKKVALIKGE